MKLLMCTACGDVFNLQLRPKSCLCGHTKGQYIDNLHAVVNGHGHSLAIGNGSLLDAIRALPTMPNDWREIPGHDPYARQHTSIICWARPHEGPRNPHTVINRAV